MCKKGAGGLFLELDGECGSYSWRGVTSLGQVPSWADVMLEIAEPWAGRLYQRTGDLGLHGFAMARHRAGDGWTLRG